MNLRAVGWGVAFLALGILLATGLLASAWGAAPRAGVATLFLVLGLVTILAGNAAWILRRTTRPEDYRGGCPVGATCACGHFNFKPRKSCKQCGAITKFAA